MTTLTLSPNSTGSVDIDPSIRIQKREQRSMLMLLTPALAVVIFLLVVPLAWLFFQSFKDGYGFTLENYTRIFTEAVYWKTFLTTFKISLIVTLATLILGYPVAYAVTQLPKRWSSLILVLVLVPFWTSVLVRTYAWMIMLQNSGLVNHALMGIGLTDAPIKLTHNQIGTIIATVHILLPFMVLPLCATMQKIPRDLMLAGSSLGAKPGMIFWRIFLPLSMSGVVAGTTLVFVLCLGFYITPELMGGGHSIMASVLVSRNIELYSDWGAASAVSVVLLICVIAIFQLVSRLASLEKILGVK